MRRNSPPGADLLALVAFDELHNPLGLPKGLGDLPLTAEKDGWHSVLGSWNGTTKNPEAPNKETPQSNFGILIAPANPRRNAHSGPILIFVGTSLMVNN